MVDEEVTGSQMDQEQYTPPHMPDYPQSYEDIMATLSPYYQEERPLDYFFEFYVVSALDKLPKETELALGEFNIKHPSFFESSNGDWKGYVKSQLSLSTTIEVAIWDLWIRNSTNASNSGWEYHPWHYAQDFLDNYFSEDSNIDIWEGDTLELAKKRILEFRKNSN